MKHLLILTLALGGLLLTHAPAGATADGPAANSVDVGKYQWKNRVLLIFAGSDTDAQYQQQLRLLDGDGAAMDERDVVIGAFTDETGGVLGTTALSPKAVAGLRAQFGVDEGAFAVLLLGKDGGVKLHRDAPVTAATLTDLIDAMPMRQAEARGR